MQHATCCREQILPSHKAARDSAGIDKPNIRRIIHYGAPATLEAYYQQARPRNLCTCCPRRVFTPLKEYTNYVAWRRSGVLGATAWRPSASCFGVARTGPSWTSSRCTVYPFLKSLQ